MLPYLWNSTYDLPVLSSHAWSSHCHMGLLCTPFRINICSTFFCVCCTWQDNICHRSSNISVMACTRVTHLLYMHFLWVKEIINKLINKSFITCQDCLCHFLVSKHVLMCGRHILTLIDNEAVLRKLISGNTTSISPKQEDDFGWVFPDDLYSRFISQVQGCHLTCHPVYKSHTKGDFTGNVKYPLRKKGLACVVGTSENHRIQVRIYNRKLRRTCGEHWVLSSHPVCH